MGMSERRTLRTKITSLSVRPDLWKLVRLHAAEKDISLADVMERALEMYLLPCDRNADFPVAGKKARAPRGGQQ